ncbi:MAG TPA: 50S ribosomal protein L29 [Rhodospirillales bacterium]|nr:50S ribosomal protein L29 [Rhodospirillales bacterium]
MDAKELRLKTDDELSDQLVNLRKEAFNLRFRAASGQLENTARVRDVRRTIARVKTIIRQRKQAAPAGA